MQISIYPYGWIEIYITFMCLYICTRMYMCISIHIDCLYCNYTIYALLYIHIYKIKK